MKILAITAFDPASVVLSHRDLMRAAGHDFRLAAVRAYTPRQAQADWVLERCETGHEFGRVYYKNVERREPDEEFREFYRAADVVQWHPGIGFGLADPGFNASDGGPLAERVDPLTECAFVRQRFWPGCASPPLSGGVDVVFVHGSMNTRRHLDWWRAQVAAPPGLIAASTIDYAIDLDAAYLPPFVDVGSPVVADPAAPLVIAHAPTDFEACSTGQFLALCARVGVPVRLLHGKPHEEVLAAKRECNAGFDHMRGGFSVNTLENACLGLVSLFKCPSNIRGVGDVLGLFCPVRAWDDLEYSIRLLKRSPEYRCSIQQEARRRYDAGFSAEAITKRLLDFYRGLV